MPFPPIGHRALREGRVSEAGRYYFITKNAGERVGQDWLPERKLTAGRLIQPGVPAIIVGSLTWLQQQGVLDLAAYCVMPDHLHLLIQLGESTPLSTVLQRFSSFTGLQVYRATGQGHLWAVGFFDRALRAETSLAVVVDYIEQNPVKAGWVTAAQDSPWSSIHTEAESSFGLPGVP